MSRRFWVADLHLGHGKVSEIRGFSSTNTHDNVLLGQIDRLREGDVLWVLGDISSGRPEGEQRALNILKALKNDRGFEMHLIAGNHDSVSSIHRTGYKKQREWLNTFDSIQQFGRIKLGGHHVLMSHYPYARSGDGPNREGSRYNEFRLPDVGAPLIHGHTHQDTPHINLYGDWENELLRPWESKILDTQQFCVSWDSHRRLVTEKDLTDWLVKI